MLTLEESLVVNLKLVMIIDVVSVIVRLRWNLHPADKPLKR